MAQDQKAAESALEIDRLATQLAKDPHSKVFMPLAEAYGKAGMWQEAAAVLEDGLKFYPGFITAMVALGRAYDHMGQALKAKAILEESVKLSPENLRAHRTLIKIYQGQGLNESALQSCAVILAVNPRDEEALSAQSTLGGPLKQKQKPSRLNPAAPGAYSTSAQTVTEPPASAELTASAQDLSVSTPTDSQVASTGTCVVENNTIEPALRIHNQTKEQPAAQVRDPQATNTVEMAPPSSHAEVVAQLESWLRSIESRRHNRDTANGSHPKVS
jgi:tetratricopeptide (TPR) repeat protein